jgi:hypothetical protein
MNLYIALLSLQNKFDSMLKSLTIVTEKYVEGVGNEFAAECPTTATAWAPKNGFFEK